MTDNLSADVPVLTDLSLKEAMVKLCESMRLHDERAMKIYETEVSVLAHEGEILRLQETTQRQVESLALSTEKLATIVPELMMTIVALTKQHTELMAWLTKEVTQNRRSQQGLLWKVIAGVLGAFSVLLTAYIASKGGVP